ncbi:MAG: hypothetical protein K2H92_05615 [Bacteroidaceae bacterium]|nr:hypothetical protein [Bacteroidaceae bacterium]
MTTKAVNKLIDRYLEGKTSPDEERRLALEVNRPDAPAEWKVVSEMLGDLTLGEALYEETLARRRRRRATLYMGWTAAACIAFVLVMGYVEQQKLQRKEAVELAQSIPTEAPMMVETTPAEVQHEPEPAAVEVVAYTPKVRKRKPTPAEPASPVVVEEEEEVMEEPPVQPTLQVSEAELAQVEADFRLWQLRWEILNESIELEIATEQLNKKYAMYLAKNKDNIEI